MVGSFQKARILNAFVAEVSECGYAATTIARVVRRAGVSRRTFYQLFDGREGCLLACLDDAVARAGPELLAAYDSGSDWAEGVRNALEAALGFLDRQPQLARVCVVETLTGGPAVLARRRELVVHLSVIVQSGATPPRRGQTAIIAELAVGSVLGVVQARLLDQTSTSLSALSSELTSMLVLPFLGPRRAHRELQRAPGPPHSGKALTAEHTTAPPGVRLTHRTVRTLTVIHERPGMSNADVGRASGIEDAGQISKLLSRLAARGLILNTALPRASSCDPNAWSLTDDGKRLMSVLGRDGHRTPAAVSVRT